MAESSPLEPIDYDRMDRPAAYISANFPRRSAPPKPKEIPSDFDPHYMTLLLLEKARQAELSYEAHLKNMLDICVFCQTRGTKIGKSIRNMSLKGKVKMDILWYMDTLRCRYAIEDRSELGTTVTVGRIVACYPFMMATVLATGLVPIAGKVPDGFPRFLCFSASPSLFPANRKDDLMAKWLRWQVSFAKGVVSISDHNVQVDYGEFAYNNLAVPLNERERLYNSLLSNPPRVGGSGEPSPLEAIDCEHILKLVKIDERDKENSKENLNFACFAYICRILPLAERVRDYNSLLSKSPRVSGSGEPSPLEAIDCEELLKLVEMEECEHPVLQPSFRPKPLDMCCMKKLLWVKAQKEELSYQAHLRDMLDICVFCGTRGTNITKATRSMSLEGTAKMEKLRRRFAFV
eukprot:GHVS01066908.1.p1 GENE.GHVS01066908.1~~GHVS01066908.1.p1  ORF type:complete len:405 (+),score=36.34 GHVS01066908.1:244-1458(+)